MSVIYPEATRYKGNVKVKAVLSVADVAAPKLATEINAVTSVDVSCFLRDFNAAVNLNSGTAPPRLCTTTLLPQEGDAEFQAIELRYVYDPQEADTTDNNKAKATLEEGLEVYLIVRKGLAARGVAYAATQRAEVWKVRLGKQIRTRSGDDAQAEFEIQQMAYPIVEPELDAVIAA
ncbi:hypothetical protein [Mumia sp. DW29H23]|uniref:phage tail tube protein n=1 Tax=Mumia sp. DW29H23 TaxID=3421241 RepID=UPI003D6895F4